MQTTDYARNDVTQAKGFQIGQDEEYECIQSSPGKAKVVVFRIYGRQDV